MGNEDYIDHWTNKWADLLQVNRKFLGTEGSKPFRDWIRNEIAGNTPYDEFVRKILTASGSNKVNPPASYYKILRKPEDTMENTTHFSLPLDSTATNATTIPLSAGRRTNTTSYLLLRPDGSEERPCFR